MQENKRYRGLKTGKWISIRSLVPGLLLTVRSARCHCCFTCYVISIGVFSSLGYRVAQLLAPRRPLKPVRRERKTIGAQVRFILFRSQVLRIM